MLITELKYQMHEYIKLQFDIDNYIVFKFEHETHSCFIISQVIDISLVEVFNTHLRRYCKSMQLPFNEIAISHMPEYKSRINTIYLRGSMYHRDDADLLWSVKQGYSKSYVKKEYMVCQRGNSVFTVARRESMGMWIFTV